MFEVKMNQVLNENERILEQVICKDIVNIIVNSSVDNAYVNVHECEKCLKLETELLNKMNFNEKEIYDKLFRSYTTLEKHCISLEVNTQLNQEIFQRDNSVSNQSAQSFDQYFELNKLKAQSQEKDTVIKMLKERIKSLRVKPSTSASGSQPSGNTKKDKIQQTPSSTQKNKVEAHSRTVKSSLKNKTCVAEPNKTTNVQHSKLNANFELLCVKCNGCMLFANHDLCVLDFINNVNARAKSKSVKKSSKRKVWKPIGKVFTNIGYSWRPTGGTFNIVGNVCPLTRITTTAEVPLRKPTTLKCDTSKTVVTLVYSRKPRKSKTNIPIVQIVLWYLDSGCSKHMTEDRSQLTNFVNKFLGTVKFRNDHVAKILGYGNNLYTLSLGDMMASSPICLLSKASKTKSWLWHRRLSHLNFGAINHLARHGLVRGLPKLKFEKDHLCSACAMGKSKKKPHKPKSEDTNQEKLYLLHMDLCGPMRVANVNGKMYILVFVDDYSRFTWVKFLRSKDEAPDFIIKWNRTLIEAARTMLIYAKALLFLWAESVATACYTPNRSIVRLHHGTTPYELLHDKLPDLSFFHVFGALCYPTNDSENLGKLQPKADIDFDELNAMASEHSSSGLALYEMTPATISSGLVPKPPPSTPFVPPSRSDWDILFQPLFDDLITLPPSVDHPAPEVIAPINEVVAPVPAISTGSTSSTTIDQDAPSPSYLKQHSKHPQSFHNEILKRQS
ncbi:retrovirus-related pol polyprotein from transposon TNT 1-94 [Tanacetum coccineum]|uniref:Retrovirus-related pol polyprotein from transposon TNT 1-94 n=1 Tax=Tanacetum coccineum TaxID=301880 RepID=A0ABQ5DYK7_9ASTR